MLNRGKKGLALLLSTVFAVAAVAGAFPVVTFAQDEPTQAVVVQQEGEAAPADLPRRNPGRRKKPPRSRRNRRSRRGNRRPTPRPCPRVRS